MPRTSKARPEEVLNAVDQTINHGELILAGQAQNQVSENIAQVELHYHIDMPYNKDVFMALIRSNRAETGRRLVEIGVMLMHLRERERENFGAILEELDMSDRFARRMIQSAAKMHKHLSLQNLGSGKMLELMTEDDDALAALENGGTLAGLHFDEIDHMSVRELKATLRAKNQAHAEDKETDEAIIRAKDERINKLTRDKRKVETSPARDKVAELLADMDENTVEAVRLIRLLVEGSRTIDAVYADDGDTIDPDVVDRIHQNVDFVADWLRQLAQIKGE